MRQVFLQKGAVIVKEVCSPSMSAHDVLVAVRYSFMNTGAGESVFQDEQNNLFSNVPTKIKKVLESVASHGIEGTAALIKSTLKGESQTLGYSCSGRVIAVGEKVRSVRPGDYVACAGAGYAHHADLVCVPENLTVKVHPAYFKEASITAVGAIALQGLRQADVKLGETVCVIGLGLLGQLTVQLAKKSGCKVIGVDLVPERLELAASLGADRVLHPTHDNVLNDINFMTDHYGVDATVITAAAKNDMIIQQAMEYTRKRGTVVLVGDVYMKFDRNPFYMKEIDFRISCSYGPGRHDANYEQSGIDYPYPYVRWTEKRNMQAFAELLEKGDINFASLISHEMSIETIAQMYPKIKEQRGLGALITYDLQEQYTVEHNKPAPVTPVNSFQPPQRDSLRVGMIGAGSFAKAKLMPAISKLPNIIINAVADLDIAASINSANMYGAAKICNDYKDLLNDEIDVAIIASPHKFHASQAIDALARGKAVFLEKPMVTDWQQLEEISSVLKMQAHIPFCVDYNRSFAPFMQKIKKVLNKRLGPLMMHYRMNTGLITKEYRTQSDIGEGRIIGEACHIVDLFCFLTEAKVRAVSVESMHSKNEHLFPTDNFSVQLSFDDGSICSLLYTTVGHTALSREHMELFFDGKTIIMDDYRTLKGYGMYPGFDEVTITPNKGHENLITQFFDACSAPNFVPPISYERLQTVAELTLIIDSLACQGGGAQTT